MSMTKRFRPDGFRFDQPIISIMDVGKKGPDPLWLRKSAAILSKEISALCEEKGKTFVHLIAVGDYEKIGPNRNGDAFPKEANQKYHHTFVKFANFYRHHKNRPDRGDPVYGSVRHSGYNDEMGRIELVIAIDNEKAPDTIQKLAEGKEIGVSMSCKVPFDFCLVCKNKATTTADYCDCLKKHAGHVLDDGRVVGMLNTEPTFFDISEVVRNADRIALMLRKVASEEAPSVICGEQPDLRELEKFNSRRKFLQKLAEEERALFQKFKSDDSFKNISSALAEPVGLPISKVASDALSLVLGSLKSARVSLSLEDFLKLVMGSRFNEVQEFIPDAKACLPTIFSDSERNPEDFLSGVKNYENLIDGVLPRRLKEALGSIIEGSSLAQGPVQKRISLTILRKRAGCLVPYEKSRPAGRILAREYARYKTAFLEGLDPETIRLSILQHFA